MNTFTKVQLCANGLQQYFRENKIHAEYKYVVCTKPHLTGQSTCDGGVLGAEQESEAKDNLCSIGAHLHRSQVRGISNEYIAQGVGDISLYIKLKGSYTHVVFGAWNSCHTLEMYTVKSGCGQQCNSVQQQYCP